ncbi:MAG TPA: hypothetical protein VNU68_16380 [Verrucomicrobiae bacterium]|nr:hypothetical protein [Verrucomicrobiae bacterium]
MNSKKSYHHFLLSAALAGYFGAIISASGQGTAFTYQGVLNDEGMPANGLYDLAFSLFGSESTGEQIGSAITNSLVAVTNGSFSVTVDFGPNFPGADRWLEIAVRSGHDSGGFITLSPRQPIRPVPYAITASNLSGPLPTTKLSGALLSDQLSGTYSATVGFNNPANTFSGNGAGLVDVNAATVGGRVASEFWLVGGNPGSISGLSVLGTTDDSPLELWVNGQRSFRLEPTTDGPNVIGGFSGNTVWGTAIGVTIGGGGALGQPNFVDAYAYPDEEAPTGYGVPNYTTVAGGSANQIVSGGFSTISGGLSNTIAGWSTFYDVERSTIGGGAENTIDGSAGSTISGGQSNLIMAMEPFEDRYSTIGGGIHNWIFGSSDPLFCATIGGGGDNTVSSDAHFAVIGGGQDNMIGPQAARSIIGGGSQNEVSTYCVLSTIAGGFNNFVQANGCAVGGGANNQINGHFSTIAGGQDNSIGDDSLFAVIGGGQGNSVESDSPNATIAGGTENLIESGSALSTVSGGVGNVVRQGAQAATIPGGTSNEASGSYSFAAGNRAKALYDGDFVWADASDGNFAATDANQFLIRATGGVGINTNRTEGAALTIAGDTRMTGLVRAGSEVGTDEPPDHGLVTRRIRSTTVADGSVVARTDILTLERDGTRGGWRIRYPAARTFLHIACMGVSSSGETANFTSSVITPDTPGAVTVYSDAQSVVFFRCSFGNGLEPGQLTEVSLTRFPGSIVWSGSLSSTYNQ